MLAAYLKLLWPPRCAEWSIGIYCGTSPLALSPHPAVGAQPVLSARSLHGMSADGVADPFMVRQGQRWTMFLEIENRRSGRGEIGMATSDDALAWHFDGVVLAEPFHLSYPHVVVEDGAHYMIPEAGTSGGVRLYKAAPFPTHWTFHSVIINQPLADATPFRHEGRWWIMALDGFRARDAMVLYYADRIEGPWHAHANNPVLANNRRGARPAGKVVQIDASPVRFAQDYEHHYGRSVSAYRIDELTPTTYTETPIGPQPLLGPGESRWNASGMHHVDAHEVTPGHWIACVDGRRTRLRWPIWDRLEARLGARR